VAPPLVPSDAVSRHKGGLWTVGNPVRINFEFLRELRQEFTPGSAAIATSASKDGECFIFLIDIFRFALTYLDTLSWQIFRTYNRLFIFSAPSLSYRFAIV
jgi:hypothetical protein